MSRDLLSRTTPRLHRIAANAREKYVPRKGTSALGEPMRDDSPAERMTAASTRRSASRDFRPLCAAVTAMWATLVAPRRTAISSAVMLMAISSGVSAPISSPTGACTRSNFSGGNAFALERLIDGEHLALAADHADVARLGAHGPAEHAHVVAVPARDDHQVAGRVRLQLLERVFVCRVNLARHREALAIGELLAVVDHADGEARGVRRLAPAPSRRARRQKYKASAAAESAPRRPPGCRRKSARCRSWPRYSG